MMNKSILFQDMKMDIYKLFDNEYKDKKINIHNLIFEKVIDNNNEDINSKIQKIKNLENKSIVYISDYIHQCFQNTNKDFKNFIKNGIIDDSILINFFKKLLINDINLLKKDIIGEKIICYKDNSKKDIFEIISLRITQIKKYFNLSFFNSPDVNFSLIYYKGEVDMKKFIELLDKEKKDNISNSDITDKLNESNRRIEDILPTPSNSNENKNKNIILPDEQIKIEFDMLY